MDAVEFLKEQERMCGSFESCLECPCDDQNNGFNMSCGRLKEEKPEAFVAIIEKWSKEHPVKTRQGEFLKMFPDVKIQKGVIDIGPCVLDRKIKDSCCGRHGTCFDCRKRYWLEEIG